MNQKLDDNVINEQYDNNRTSFVESIFKNSRQGFIGVSYKDHKGTWRNMHVDITKIEDKIGTQIFKSDAYICPNLFRYNKDGDGYNAHKEKYIIKINAIVIDLDYYNIDNLEGLPPAEVYDKIIAKYPQMPVPSYVQYSGNGMYLVWLLEDTNASSAAKAYAKNIQIQLITALAEFGADEKCKNLNRVYRLPYTINSKTGRKAEILIFNDKRYELKDLSNFTNTLSTKVTYKPRVSTNIQVNRCKLIPLSGYRKTLMDLNWTRVKDLEHLVDLRAGECVGDRDMLLHLATLHYAYSISLGIDIRDNIKELKDKVKSYAIKFNNLFTEPLTPAEVRAVVRNSVQMGKNYKNNLDNDKKIEYYKYTNKRIVSDLKITDTEQEQLNSIIGIEVKRQRKAERNAEYYKENAHKIKTNRNKRYDAAVKAAGKVKRSEKLAGKLKQIADLLSQNCKQIEIAAKLGISKSFVSKCVKKIKDSMPVIQLQLQSC